MNFKKLYLAGLTATQDNNYAKGACIQHHEESVEDAEVGIRITYLPSNYIGRIIVKVQSIKTGLSILGGYQKSVVFNSQEFEFIKKVIADSGEIIDTDLTFDKDSSEYAFDIKFKASKLWLQGFTNYRNMNEILEQKNIF